MEPCKAPVPHQQVLGRGPCLPVLVLYAALSSVYHLLLTNFTFYAAQTVPVSPTRILSFLGQLKPTIVPRRCLA
jgi:hypothetical protein